MNFPQQREFALVTHLSKIKNLVNLQCPECGKNMETDISDEYRSGQKQFYIKQNGCYLFSLYAHCRSELEDLAVGTNLTVA